MKYIALTLALLFGSVCGIGEAQTPAPPVLVPHISGIIARVGQWHILLAGPGIVHVDLHRTTVVEPTGALLRPGERVLVYGYPQQGDPLNRITINASAVIVLSAY